MQMKYTPIGRTGVHASLLALGAMTFGEKNVWKLGGLGQDTVEKLVARAVDAGINLFDTADVYDEGESEKSLGSALKPYRDQIHSWDSHVPLDESLEAMQDLVERGLVRYPGVSNFTAWQMSTLQARCEERGYSRYETAQMNYSLLNRDIEHETVV